ncbi:MAG: hypothetical protein CMI30_07715 [Opitutae bacterium]|nr:hypothetical protein [Opitutae bacterium]|tara:strand:+ start:4497 stop:4778 length:282 start_codon:yes stop_codon:yes gene_type:complete
MLNWKSLLIGLALGLVVTLTMGFDDEGQEGRYQLEGADVYFLNSQSGKGFEQAHLVKIDTKTGKVYMHTQILAAGAPPTDKWMDITGKAYRTR